MKKKDDVQLIHAVLSGDDTAFDILVEKYQKSVHALVWRKIGDFHYAEEITQDTFLRAYQNLSTLRNPSQFLGWLYVIANRLCLNWLREQKPTTHLQSLEDTSMEEVAKSAYTRYVLERRETEATEHRFEIVKKLLAKLPESERTVMTLYYLGEMTTKEIGRFLGVSVETIRTRLHRARKRLREEEELLIQEVLGSVQISASIKQNIMREVANMQPTPFPKMEPFLPWVAFGTAVVVATLLILSASNRYLTRFQKPYSFEAESEPTIEIIDAPIVLRTNRKPALRSQIGRTAVAIETRGAGLRTSDRDSTPNASADLLRLSETHWMPDANLREAIRQKLEIDTDTPLTKADMLQLTSLDILKLQIAEKISDLTGLEHAINLELLIVAKNRIRDVRPLANLTNLTFLDLGGNAISDISPLAGLIPLEVLGLWSNQIVDVSPLAGLVNLKDLALQDNQIAGISPLVGLTRLTELNVRNNGIADLSSLTDLTSIAVLHSEGNPGSVTPECELPRPAIMPRIEDREYPSVFGSWSIVRNRAPILPRLSWLPADEPIAYFDLYFSHPAGYFGLNLKYTNAGVALVGDFQRAKERRDALLAFNPNAMFLVPVIYYSGLPASRYPEDGVLQDLWLRDENGNRVVDNSEEALLDFTLPETQQWAIDQAKAIAACGLFDGIFLNHWDEGLRLGGKATLEEEHLARDIIIQNIRAIVGDDVLIMVNAGENRIPRWAGYINGSLVRTQPTLKIPWAEMTDVEKQYHSLGYSREDLHKIEETLIWSENHFQAPRINGLLGFGIDAEPPDSPRNKQWMRVFTTMSLTLSDGYVEYKFLFDTFDGPSVYWYSFWDADLGTPIGKKAQRYRNREGLYIREYTNGWAVYNRSGKAQRIELPESAEGVSSGIKSGSHTLTNLDGEIYLK